MAAPLAPGARFVDPAVLARVGNLEFVARSVVDGVVNGLHRSPLFGTSVDFAEHRNRLGGLLLLPKSFNASYGDLTYERKLPHYMGQNLLARSLHPQCYEHHPNFMRVIEEHALPFRPHVEFRKADMDARCELYRTIADKVWNPDDLAREAEGW